MAHAHRDDLFPDDQLGGAQVQLREKPVDPVINVLLVPGDQVPVGRPRGIRRHPRHRHLRPVVALVKEGCLVGRLEGQPTCRGYRALQPETLLRERNRAASRKQILLADSARR